MSGKAAFRSKNRKNDANQRLRYALTFSPVIHGLLFYLFAHLLWRRFFPPDGVGGTGQRT